MEQPLGNNIISVMAGIIFPAIFFLSTVKLLFLHSQRLYRFIAAKIQEYQGLDRGDFLTLLIDAGLSHEQALWFYDKFYDNATCWERCLIKLYIEKHCF